MTKACSCKATIGFGLAAFIIVADQISKWAILEYIIRPKAMPGTDALSFFDWLSSAPARFGFASVELLPFFNLTMVWNEGISFGLFQGSGIWILSGLALAITVLFSVWLVKAQGWLQAVSLSMVIGGAIGNVIDRARFGAVADFFDFHLMGWHYPAFNVADCAIVVGIAILVLDGIFLEPKRTNKEQAA